MDEQKSSGTSEAKRVAQAFRDGLNHHGHALHYSVMRAIENAASTHQCPWRVAAWEYPVEVKGKSTRIDLILRQNNFGKLLIVGECKRANPAKRDWVFVRSRFMEKDNCNLKLVVERAGINDGMIRIARITSQGFTIFKPPSTEIADIGMEVKGEEKGDEKIRSGSGIEDAASQACQHLNGLIECFRANPKIAERYCPTFIVPVVFTTARLWISDLDIEAASLVTGNIDGPSTAREVPHLCYQYPISPGIQHEATKAVEINSFERAYADYRRTVVFVNTAHLSEFLANFDFDIETPEPIKSSIL